ncbi:hypothetical protein HDU96_009369 [Phlyctochytrium bullatum]|nr:hypothetical protein HDU96_009369 [Phlyctochytrium bullatum]
MKRREETQHRNAIDIGDSEFPISVVSDGNIEEDTAAAVTIATLHDPSTTTAKAAGRIRTRKLMNRLEDVTSRYGMARTDHMFCSYASTIGASVISAVVFAFDWGDANPVVRRDGAVWVDALTVGGLDLALEYLLEVTLVLMEYRFGW